MCDLRHLKISFGPPFSGAVVTEELLLHQAVRTINKALIIGIGFLKR